MTDACQNVLSYIAEAVTHFQLPVVCIYFNREKHFYFICFFF